MPDDLKETKPARVALTKKQAAEGAGLELVKLAAGWLSDGKLSEAELEQLRAWLNRCPSDSIPAIGFLREEVRRYLGDGKIEPWELDRLFSALARVIPPDARAIANEARKRLRKAQEEAERPAREARRAAAFKESREYWREMRERYAEEWAEEAASEAQIEYVRDLGGALPDGASKYDASVVIDQLLNGATDTKKAGVPLPFILILILGILVVVAAVVSKFGR